MRSPKVSTTSPTALPQPSLASNESSTRLPVDRDEADGGDDGDDGDDGPPHVIPNAGGPTVAWLGLGLGLLTAGGLLLFRFRRRSQEGTP